MSDPLDLGDATGYPPVTTIDELRAKYAAPGRTIDFPPGEYPVDGLDLGLDDLTLIGDDATVVPTSAGGRALSMVGTGWLVSDFEFDYRELDLPAHVRLAGGDWTFERTIFRGTRDPRSARDEAGACSILLSRGLERA